MHAFWGMAKNFFRNFILNMIIHPRLTKFSSAYAKGPLAQRFATADKINNKIFGNVVKLYRDKKNTYPAEIIEECYNFCLPEEKTVVIQPMTVYNPKDYYGGVDFLCKMNMYVGFAIELPVTKSDKLHVKTIPTLMHESTHVLDFFLNPKFLINDVKFNELKNNDKCWGIYQEYFYNSSGKTLDEILNNARSNTKNVLKEMNPNDRLIFLNFIKYSLQMEQRAYKQDSVYANALKKIGKPFDKEDLPDFSKIMHAKEKIELVEKMLADEIKQQRKSLKNSLPDRI